MKNREFKKNEKNKKKSCRTCGNMLAEFKKKMSTSLKQKK
jgi:hypothetical protein